MSVSLHRQSLFLTFHNDDHFKSLGKAGVSSYCDWPVFLGPDALPRRVENSSPAIRHRPLEYRTLVRLRKLGRRIEPSEPFSSIASIAQLLPAEDLISISTK